MAITGNILETRKTLDQICTTDERIISVYSLEQHVWATPREEAIPERRAEVQTIKEFQIDPVRGILMDVFQHLAMPWRPERRDQPVGQGWWIQAEFGSGKSHLLCFISALALGDPAAWEEVRTKESAAGRGKRESLYRFWEDGLAGKREGGKRGVLVVNKTLVGHGGGTVGVAGHGRRLADYILDAVQEQVRIETGKNLSLYPVEMLADRFLKEDLQRYRIDLQKFLKDPRYFEEEEFLELDQFLEWLRTDAIPGSRKDCGQRLWRFYDEYLKVRPQGDEDAENVLRHMVEAVLEAGYTGMLLVLDEVSLFMQDRDDIQRSDDEATLVVLSNRLTRAHNLPIWTICAAQEAIESKRGERNISSPDRLKLELLLQRDTDYYKIVLSRVRTITDPTAIDQYYTQYRRGFRGIQAMSLDEFQEFFPFHKPGIELLRLITSGLTTARSAIHFMHETLRHQIKTQGSELIRLWELFDAAVEYTEDPGGSHPMKTIRASRPDDYSAYNACQHLLDSFHKGYLKVHREKALRTLQTLFLYHVARYRPNGLSAEEIAEAVLIEKSPDASPEENVQYYESLAENLKREFPQIEATTGQDGEPRYRFSPVTQGRTDPRREFEAARAEAEESEVMRWAAWDHLLALDRWHIRVQQATLDLSNGVDSLFRTMAPLPDSPGSRAGQDTNLEVNWQGRPVTGRVGVRNLGEIIRSAVSLPGVDTPETDHDFFVYVSSRPMDFSAVQKLFANTKDPRVLVWTPAPPGVEERAQLCDFAAYRKLVQSHQGKNTDDDALVLHWVAEQLQTGISLLYRALENCYRRGRIDSLRQTQMQFQVAGGLGSIVSPLAARVLSDVYESRILTFPDPISFKKEDGAKVINGLVKLGCIPVDARSDQNTSAALNFGSALQLVKAADKRTLDTSGNPFVADIQGFIDEKLQDDHASMKMETLYKNFMGIGVPKSYGLSRRMVQIYLLCLVQQGKVRVIPGPRTGLPGDPIDYSNIAAIDFSARILDGLESVQKIERPVHWDVLRPYAEKLLGESIAAGLDDSGIMDVRRRLRSLFDKERVSAANLSRDASALFHALRQVDPYAEEVRQLNALFETDLPGSNDIDALLHGLKRALGCEAYERGTALESEVDDLGTKMADYAHLRRFLAYAGDLRAARVYLDQPLDSHADLHEARAIQASLRSRFADLQPYIDSEARTTAELIGSRPPVAGDSGSFHALVHSYTPCYVAMHERVLQCVSGERSAIRALAGGDEMRALKILEGITALRPAVSPTLADSLDKLAAPLFECRNSSRSSVESELLQRPVHACGLDFTNAGGRLAEALAASQEAQRLFDEAMNGKMAIFQSEAVRRRLDQGHAEPRIADLLACETLAAIREYLVGQALANPSIVDVINRYLKRIMVRTVPISSFKPSASSIEIGGVSDVALEFQGFLEEEFRRAKKDEEEGKTETAGQMGDGDVIVVVRFEQ